jgi:WD40 repeat protein
MANVKSTQSVSDMRFDRQGRRLLVRGSNNLVVYDAATGRRLQQIDSNANLWAAEFDSTDRYIAIGDADRHAWIWDTEQQKRIALVRHDDNETTVAFSHNGVRVVSGGFRSDRTARVWLWRPEDLVNELCSRLQRNLTHSEWNQDLPAEPYRSTCGSKGLAK